LKKGHEKGKLNNKPDKKLLGKMLGIINYEIFK
jgi:hypothetical protein